MMEQIIWSIWTNNALSGYWSLFLEVMMWQCLPLKVVQIQILVCRKMTRKKKNELSKSPQNSSEWQSLLERENLLLLDIYPGWAGPTASINFFVNKFNVELQVQSYSFKWLATRWKRGGRWSSSRWTATKCPSLRCSRASVTLSLSWSLRVRKFIQLKLAYILIVCKQGDLSTLFMARGQSDWRVK